MQGDHDTLSRAEQAGGEALGSARAPLGRQLRPNPRGEPCLAGEDRLGRPVPHEPVEVTTLQLVDPACVRLAATRPCVGIRDAR